MSIDEQQAALAAMVDAGELPEYFRGKADRMYCTTTVGEAFLRDRP